MTGTITFLKYQALTIQTWYLSINKPDWAPPVWAFGVAWSIIYPLMAISFGYVFWQSFVKRTMPLKIGFLFAINLIFNIIYSVGTFTVFNDGQGINDIERYYWPATFVVSTVLVTLAFMIVTTWTRARWVAILQIPYILWVSLATMLQIAITLSN